MLDIFTIRRLRQGNMLANLPQPLGLCQRRCHHRITNQATFQGQFHQALQQALGMRLILMVGQFEQHILRICLLKWGSQVRKLLLHQTQAQPGH